jgi:rod shape-determining protein MreD
MLPFDLSVSAWPGPDLLFALTAAYVVRRPELVPFWAVGGIFLLNDVMHMLPLGLWTFLVLLAVEFMRARFSRFREYMFPLEWLIVALIFGLALIVQTLVLKVLFVPTPRVAELIRLFMITVAAYPLVVGFLALLFGIRKPAPGVSDALGHRI